MKCPKCKLEDNPNDYYSYFVFGFHEGKFILKCMECGYRWRPTKPEEKVIF
jgi:hypothetical protein